MDASSSLGFGSAAFVEALYEDFLVDPASVPAPWRREFESWARPAGDTHDAVQQRFRALASRSTAPHTAVPAADLERLQKQNAVQQLINEYRQRGHLRARTDPLDLLEPMVVPSLGLDYHGLAQADLELQFAAGNFPLPAGATLRELLVALEATYCGAVGFEYAYISDSQQVDWLRQRIEAGRGRAVLNEAEQRQILQALTASEGLERYLHRRYVGQKRFSLEGGDGLIPVLDEIVRRAGAADVKELVIGMAHRGRLNVLVNILGKQPRELFDEFEGKAQVVGSGDVKYHQGFSADPITPGGPIHLTLAFNPSHLEIINPVVEGSVRARQERRGDSARRQVIPLLIHGDAAFAGQGVVMETLNLAKTRGYATGGSLHIVINNQIGFTTSNPADARSTYYCTEIARLTQAPVFHVNGDDPEALLFVTRLALDFRLAFGSDVVIDLVCYRRQGHNEADEPAITQPRMYAKIASHPSVRELYARRLESAGVLAGGQAQALAEAYQQALDRGECVAPLPMSDQRPLLAIDWAPYMNTLWTEPALNGGATGHPARAGREADNDSGRLQGPPAGGQDAGRSPADDGRCAAAGLGLRRDAGLRHTADGRLPGAPVRPGQRSRHLLAPPCRPAQPGPGRAGSRRSAMCRCNTCSPASPVSWSSTRCCRRRPCSVSSTATPVPTRRRW